ncbi:MAG: hypothetical protein ABI321_15390 [Polyangia bacterium]
MLALVALAGSIGAGGCGQKRKPIGRGDAGPSVIVTDGRAVDLGALPSSPEVEPNDTPAQAQPLSGPRVRGVVTVGGARPDVDLYRVDVPTPASDTGDGGVAWVATVALHAGDTAVTLDVLDDAGKPVLTRVAAPHQLARVTNLRLDVPAIVRVRRPTKKGQPDIAADYTIEAQSALATAALEREPNDDPAHANVVGDTVTGTLDPFDRDVFTLPTVREGSTFEVELAAIPDLAPEIRLRRGDEVVVTARAGKGGELRMRNVPSGAGLVLQLRVIDGASDSPYALKLGPEAPLDAATVEHEPNEDRAHATHVSLAAGSIDVAGYLWPGDVDFYCADVGFSARVEAMPNVDFGLETFDASGRSLAKVNAGKRGSAEAVPFLAAARCVKVIGLGRSTAFDAPYRLAISATQ